MTEWRHHIGGMFGSILLHALVVGAVLWVSAHLATPQDSLAPRQPIEVELLTLTQLPVAVVPVRRQAVPTPQTKPKPTPKPKKIKPRRKKRSVSLSPARSAAPAHKAVTAPRTFASSANGTAGMARTTSPHAVMQRYYQQLVRHIERKKFYPSAAKRRRLQGSAELSFTLSASGTLLSAHILHSSGHVLLDDAALATLHKAAPFPPPPSGKASFRLPVRYRGRG